MHRPDVTGHKFDNSFRKKKNTQKPKRKPRIAWGSDHEAWYADHVVIARVTGKRSGSLFYFLHRDEGKAMSRVIT